MNLLVAVKRNSSVYIKELAKAFTGDDFAPKRVVATHVNIARANQEIHRTFNSTDTRARNMFQYIVNYIRNHILYVKEEPLHTGGKM